MPPPKPTGRPAARDGTFKKLVVLGRGRGRGRPGAAAAGRPGLAGACGAEAPRREPGRLREGLSPRPPRRPAQRAGRAARGEPASVPEVGGASHLDSGHGDGAARAGPVGPAAGARCSLHAALSLLATRWAAEGALRPFYSPGPRRRAGEGTAAALATCARSHQRPRHCAGARRRPPTHPGVARAGGAASLAGPTRGCSAPAQSSSHATVTVVTTGFPQCLFHLAP